MFILSMVYFYSRQDHIDWVAATRAGAFHNIFYDYSQNFWREISISSRMF